MRAALAALLAVCLCSCSGSQPASNPRRPSGGNPAAIDPADSWAEQERAAALEARNTAAEEARRKERERLDRERERREREARAEAERQRQAREQARIRRVEAAIALLDTEQERQVVGVLWKRLRAGTFRLSELTPVEAGMFRLHQNILSGPELSRVIAEEGASSPQATQHITNLGLQGTPHEKRVRASFALLDLVEVMIALQASAAIKRDGLANLSPGLKQFVRDHPDLFPVK